VSPHALKFCHCYARSAGATLPMTITWSEQNALSQRDGRADVRCCCRMCGLGWVCLAAR
jgi:hypothetical protein